MVDRHPREQELVELYDLFIAKAREVLDGTAGENAPTAGHLREIREFLFRNQVTLDFVMEREQEGPSNKGALRSFRAPFPATDSA